MEELKATVHALDELLDRLDAGQSPTDVELYAVAYMLESFYTWVENVFQCIARALEESLPEGPSWHLDLLRQMAQPTPHRPAVISPELYPRLAELRTFRHRSRNLSLQMIAWAPINPLATGSRKLLTLFDKDIHRFLNQMDTPRP